MLYLRKKGINVEFKVLGVNGRSNSRLKLCHDSLLISLILVQNLLQRGQYQV